MALIFEHIVTEGLGDQREYISTPQRTVTYSLTIRCHVVVSKNADAPVKPAGDDKTIPLVLLKEIALIA